jgi:type VI secretion system protein ImpE
MPTAKELLDAGKLAGAIEAATAEVKANPTDVPRRTTLFELLCFAGDWDRAEKQIDVIGQQSMRGPRFPERGTARSSWTSATTTT